MSEINRRNLYKNSDKDFESLRRNRNDHSVEIRKAKKDDHLQKRRNIVIEDMSDDNLDNLSIKENAKPTKDIEVKEIPKLLKSKNITDLLDAATSCRKKLSKQQNPPIEEFYKNGTIPLLVSIMGNYKDEILLFECAWALTNIASGESKHTAAVVEAGAIPVFINLMSSVSDQVSEQSIWALSNIAGDGAKYRDMIVKHGVIDVIKTCINRFWNKVEVLRQLSWFISNLCRHKNANFPTAGIIELLPIIRQILVQINDVACSLDLTWALSYSIDSRDELINAVIANDIVPVINANLQRKEVELITPSLRSIGNIIAGTNEQADVAIKCGVIISVGHLLSNKNIRIVKESCWVLSNITAGSQEQIQACVDCDVMIPLLEVLKNGDYKSQKEAAWAVSNMANSTNDSHKLYLLNNNVLQAIVPLLSCDDNKVVMLLLDAIQELFLCADRLSELDQCINLFESIGGIDLIESLQNHESAEIYTKSYDLIKEFFNGDEDDEEHEEPPQIEKYAF